MRTDIQWKGENDMKKKMKQKFYDYTQWEDYKNGMWSLCEKNKEPILLQTAIKFTSDASLYGEWMLKIIKEWPITCMQNLSEITPGRRAFIGHCAVSLALNIPEYITRMAWGFLTIEQQNKANQQADYVIQQWEIQNARNAYSLFTDL